MARNAVRNTVLCRTSNGEVIVPMNIDDLSKIHTGQDTRVSFSWVEPSSSTPTALTGGHVRLKLEGTGLKSYAYEIGSDPDPELVEWTNRVAGTGAAMLQLTDEPLPLGLMRFQ